MNRSDLRFAIEMIATALGENKWFRDVALHIDGEIKEARQRLKRAGLFSRAKRRDELLDQIGYGVQNLLRAACLIHAQRIEAGTDGTAQPVQPEGREPDGEADAPNPLKDRDHD